MPIQLSPQTSLRPPLQRWLFLSATIALCTTASLVVAPRLLAQSAPRPQPDGYSQGGEGVANIQQRLAELGYYQGEISGYYGPETQSAISRFQQDMGLTVDGIIGPNTAQALFDRGFSAQPPQPSDANSPYGESTRTAVQFNDAGNQVAELQQRLADLGYYQGEISGSFDYATEAAVMQFQQANGLEADGVVGANTEAALRRPAEEISRPYDASQPNDQSYNVVPTDGVLRSGSTGQTVSDLQLRLKELGFYHGEISGVYGPETETAVIAFQQAQGLTIDGIAGPQVHGLLYDFAGSSEVASASTGVPVSPTTDSAMTTENPVLSSTGDAVNNNPAPTSGLSTGAATAEGVSATPSTPAVEQVQQEAEQARLEAEQARLEAEQARLVLSQNFEEGRYSVVALQQALREQGFYRGEVNGIFSDDTQQALIEAQQEHGLNVEDFAPSNFTTLN